MKKILSSILMALSLFALTACGGSKDEDVAINFLNHIAEGQGEKAYSLVSVSKEESSNPQIAKFLKESIIVLAKETKKLGGFKSFEVKEVTNFKDKEGIKVVTVHVMEKNGNEGDFIFYTGDYKGDVLIYNLEVKNIKEVAKKEDESK